MTEDAAGASEQKYDEAGPDFTEDTSRVCQSSDQLLARCLAPGKDTGFISEFAHLLLRKCGGETKNDSNGSLTHKSNAPGLSHTGFPFFFF